MFDYEDSEKNHRDEMAGAIRSIPKHDPKLPVIERLRLIVKERQANRVGGVLVDMFSASVVVQVYDKLNETNRAKLAALPVRKMVAVCFKLIE